jgi:hypothetical protein
MIQTHQKTKIKGLLTMYISGSTLRTTADFDNAILFGLNIEVYQQNEPIDRGGIIKSHTEDSVTIDGAKFLKAVYAFKVR